VDVDIEVLGFSMNRFEQCRIETAEATTRCAGISRARWGKRDYYKTVLPCGRLMDMGSGRRSNTSDDGRKTERPRFRITITVADPRPSASPTFASPSSLRCPRGER